MTLDTKTKSEWNLLYLTCGSRLRQQTCTARPQLKHCFEFLGVKAVPIEMESFVS